MSHIGELGAPVVGSSAAAGSAQPNAASHAQRSNAAGQTIGSGVPSHLANAANHRIASLELGNNGAAGASQSSFLDAVVGQPSATAPGAPAQRQAAPSAFRQATTPSNGSTPRSFGASTEREWDVLSDVSPNDGGKGVEELQKTVDKRRSNLPHLESELAALEAQIRAAEERIAKAQSAAPQGTL